MSYLVVKQSGSNKSYELKTSVPEKPYMLIKPSVSSSAYLALATDTSGSGLIVRGKSANYKVVESYTTTVDTSSTYTEYYSTSDTILEQSSVTSSENQQIWVAKNQYTRTDNTYMSVTVSDSVWVYANGFFDINGKLSLANDFVGKYTSNNFSNSYTYNGFTFKLKTSSSKKIYRNSVHVSVSLAELVKTVIDGNTYSNNTSYGKYTAKSQNIYSADSENSSWSVSAGDGTTSNVIVGEFTFTQISNTSYTRSITNLTTTLTSNYTVSTTSQ